MAYCPYLLDIEKAQASHMSKTYVVAARSQKGRARTSNRPSPKRHASRQVLGDTHLEADKSTSDIYRDIHISERTCTSKWCADFANTSRTIDFASPTTLVLGDIDSFRSKCRIIDKQSKK